MISIRFFPHATTTDNEAGISTGSVEVELSELGKKQKMDLKDVVQDEQFDAVFSSDLKRAHETAEAAFGDRYSITLDTRLREINIGDMTRMADAETGPMMYEHVDIPFPNGESLKNVEERVKDFLTSLLPAYDSKKIAIVAHQGPQLALEVITKGITWEEALDTDWRNTKSFQYGWDYRFGA
jgi:broad specificity phosphatase PhoE